VNSCAYRALALRRGGAVLHATLNGPETMNAIDDERHDELQRLFEACALPQVATSAPAATLPRCGAAT